MRTTPVRSREPGATWDLMAPRLREHGITRVADLTGLDTVGMPVAMAVRPRATTVGISQGKGADRLTARLSAVMEAIEVDAAERLRPADALVATAAELGLPYPVEAVTDLERSVLSGDLPLAWVPAEDLTGHGDVPVPLLAVQMDGVADDVWRPRAVFSSTNGLASGNDLDEATVQGLFEVCERDAVAGLAALGPEDRAVLDLDTLPESPVRDLVARLVAARFWVEVVSCPALPGLAAFTAYVWAGDMPGLYAGSGAHVVPEVALERALAEAVQSRMSVISGTREDLGPHAYRGVRRPVAPRVVRATHGWGDLPPGTEVSPGTRLGDLRSALVDTVASATGHPVLRVDLTPPGAPIGVAKVLAPGLRFDVYRQLTRPAEEAA